VSTETHPVWSVYDRLRTARLNHKYYCRRLERYERLNFWIEVVLLATAPSSAIGALWFWDSAIGSPIWKALATVAAIIVMIKPLLHIPSRIKDYESIICGYRALEFDLQELRTLIEQRQAYDHKLQTELRKILKREKALVTKGPEPREHAATLKKCQDEVLSELPVSSFFVPEDHINAHSSPTRLPSSTTTFAGAVPADASSSADSTTRPPAQP